MRYIIGIDLGTTNCTMAYTLIEGDSPSIHQFAIPQITEAGVQASLPSLPSFLYFPLPEEIKAKSIAISWNKSSQCCVGTYARERGAELPARLIASAKSWLCHGGIDRRAKLLPQHATENIQISPLEACAAFLTHLREAWNNTMDEPFEKQSILVTVPASFDPSARQLVQEAAALAGYPETILLEEPQAAFYAWLNANTDTWRKDLTVGDAILVVDIGGGTTDFSLITVDSEHGNLVLQRQAVGSHLLLGGDNIDLSLAYLAKNKLEEEGHAIDEWQLQALVHACRKAKEQLMSEKPPKTVDVTIMGRSSKLVAGTLKTKISREEAESLILDGFAPLIEPHEGSPTERRTGIQQIGLPYAQDARISCQLAKFLSMTGEAGGGTTDGFIMPTAVLFNGGTLKSAALKKRLMELLNFWAQKLKKVSVKELPNADLDFAVSQGAVYYGFSRIGKAIRIKSSSSRSYYIGVEDAMPAVPGLPVSLKAICVVPFGLEEGSEMDIHHQEFSLVVGEPAAFRFFSHSTKQLSNGQVPSVGTAVKNWRHELTELPSIEAHLDKSDSDGKTIRVKLKSKLTELGVLELWCVSQDGRRWKLEFDARSQNSESKMALSHK